MTTFPEALAAELGQYVPGATPQDWEREAAAILTRVTPSDPRAEVEAPRQFLSEMDDIERRYTLAVHDLYCDEEPPGHTAMAHEPFDGVDDPDELVPWSAVVDALAAHGLILARPAPPSEGPNLERLRNIVAIAQGRVDAGLSGRGDRMVWQRLGEDLATLAAALTPADPSAE
jgi:hypothetical protein